MEFRPRVGQLVRAVRVARKKRVPPALPPVEGEWIGITVPANWRAFVGGMERQAAMDGKTVPALPDDPPPGITFRQIVQDVLRGPGLPAPWSEENPDPDFPGGVAF